MSGYGAWGSSPISRMSVLYRTSARALSSQGSSRATAYSQHVPRPLCGRTGTPYRHRRGSRRRTEGENGETAVQLRSSLQIVDSFFEASEQFGSPQADSLATSLLKSAPAKSPGWTFASRHRTWACPHADNWAGGGSLPLHASAKPDRASHKVRDDPFRGLSPPEWPNVLVTSGARLELRYGR